MKNGLEKQELFKHIWNVANDLRGKVSGWEFQSYILGTIFYRYLSENYVKRINKELIEEGGMPSDFDYAKLTDEMIDNSTLDKKDFIASHGFFLYPSELFTNVLEKAKKGEINISEVMGKVFRNIEDSASLHETSSGVFKNLFDSYDVNSISLGETVEKRNNQLVKLLSNIGAIDFGNEFTENTSDMLGDAYEFLIGMYAANAGKSGGEYFTPQEVSTLLTQIGLHNQEVDDKKIFRVYDPTCGSGSLLLKSRKILHKDNIEFYGQESNPTTFNLCRMNMVLHNVKFGNIHIACEDTLISPKHNKTVDECGGFDLIVSNPPYSVKWDGKNNPLLMDDPRYSPAGVLAPSSKADLAFVLHSLHYLNSTGKAAIVCFPGVMYRGGAEQKIREYLIKNNYVDAIIQMPDNLFFGTSIATSILILNKAKTDQNILFIDGSNDYVQDTNNNRLSEQNIADLLKTYQDRKNIEHKAILISNDEVLKNKSTLAVSSYISAKDDGNQVDIDELNKELNETVANINYLRNEIQGLINEIVK